MEKINVAELLKDCPKGMELDCTMYEDVCFYEITESSIFPVCIKRADGAVITLTKYGGYADSPSAKCVIFPKGKTTWKGFQRPFVDGDVITSVFQGVIQGTGIFDYEEQSEAWVHACINLNDEFFTEGYLGHVYYLRFATEEEKEKLFRAIKDKGYKWNSETKTLEKLPKFKVGDKIKLKGGDDFGFITQVADCFYTIKNKNHTHYWPIKKQDDWELVPNKFDITTLIPFESRVLVRVCDIQIWTPTFWGKYIKNGSNYSYLTTNGCYKYCIPYEGNEHLLGTNKDCDEYFKTWE